MSFLLSLFDESALPCPCRHTGRCPDDNDPPEDDDENQARAEEREETDRRSA